MELVRYFNKNPERKPIKYWSIGNEPLLRVRNDRAVMMKTLEEVVYPFLIRLAPAMKEADPTIKILVFNCEGLPGANTERFNCEAHEALCGGRLDITGKDKNGNWMVDGVKHERRVPSDKKQHFICQNHRLKERYRDLCYDLKQ